MDYLTELFPFAKNHLDLREIREKSPWWLYLATLPKLIELPARWLSNHDNDSVEALHWSKRTELGNLLEKEKTVTLVRYGN